MVSTTYRRLTHPQLLLWLTVGILLAALALPYLREMHQRTTMGTDLFASGAMRVGLDPSRPPFAYFTETGKYTGLEIDLAYAIGNAIQVEIEFVPLGFDGLFDALRTNQADIIIAGQQPDFSRDGNGVLYSRHYFDAGLVLASRGQITDMRDLAGSTLAYEFGSPADSLAHRWLRRIAPFELRPYELPEHAMMALHVNEADAALVDATTARLYLQDNPDLTGTSLEQTTHAWYAITVREGREDVLGALNTTLKHLHDDGTLEQIIDKWM